MGLENPTKELESNIKGIYDMLSSGQAPAHVGKAVFAKDLDYAKACGAGTMAQLFGHREESTDVKKSMKSLNFGSKAETSFMPEETRMRLFELKKDISNAQIQAGILNHTSNPTAAQIEATPTFKNTLQAKLKAFNVTDFSNWIPTIHARFYFEEYEIPYLLANKFDQQPMESATVEVEGALGLLEGKEEADSNTFDSQSNTQSNFTVYARNNVVHSPITQDLLADSAPPIIDKYRKEVVAGIARSYERAMINGDITDTGGGRGSGHQDSDIAAVSKHFSKAFNGLRKIASANSANGSTYDHGGDTMSKLLFQTMLKKMGRFGSEKDDLLWVYGSVGAGDLVTGAIPELFTAFAFGGLASNVTGQVPPVFGIQGVESRYIREDLNASGVYQSGQTKSCLILVKKSRFMNFNRAAIRVWAAPSLPSSDFMLMTAKMRHAFAGTPQTALETSVILGYNIATV